MKKTDIAMIILIASVSVVASYFVAKSTPIGQTSNKPVKVQTIERISAEVQEPSPEIFNSNAINPSVEVQIGSGSVESIQTDDGAE